MKQFYFAIAILLVVLSCTGKQRKLTTQNEGKDTTYLLIENQSVDSLVNDSDSTEHLVKFSSKYWFWDFETKEYVGKLANPDFTGNPYVTDKEYVELINEGCKENGINFGGHYTIIEKRCGCMCEHIFIVDRKSGKIFPRITLNKDDDGDGKYGYRYWTNSKLLIANSTLLQAGDGAGKYCYTTAWGVEPELYVWTGDNFRQLKDWRVDDSYRRPSAPKKRLSFKNVAEILADDSYSTWTEVKDSTASLALRFDYDGAVLAAYSSECYLTFPCKLEENKIVVYWDVDIDTKYDFDMVKAMNRIDKKYIGKPFMVLELANDTTFKATYPLPELIQKVNSSSTEKPQRTFFPNKYVIIQQGYLY